MTCLGGVEGRDAGRGGVQKALADLGVFEFLVALLLQRLDHVGFELHVPVDHRQFLKEKEKEEEEQEEEEEKNNSEQGQDATSDAPPTLCKVLMISFELEMLRSEWPSTN